MADVVYGALGQVEEHPVYDLPKEWKTLVSTLCLRTNFEPAELADLFQRFRQLAGEGRKRRTSFLLFSCCCFGQTLEVEIKGLRLLSLCLEI